MQSESLLDSSDSRILRELQRDVRLAHNRSDSMSDYPLQQQPNGSANWEMRAR